MTVSDKELLELAAKAAGAKPYTDEAWPGLCFSDSPTLPPFFVNKDGCGANSWDPLTDDGDALRLAVKLQILIDVSDSAIVATDGKLTDICELIDGDPYAATRRAIVRAAAEIGKTL